MPTTAASVVSSLGPHCAYYCGFCGEFVGTTVPPTAASVVSLLCTLYWARDNCAHYCGFCGEFVGTTLPTTAASVVSS